VGLLKKTLAVGTLGGSVAAEKAAKLAAEKVADARSEESKIARAEKKALDDEARAAALAQQNAEREAAGIIFEGTSHDSGRNARVTLYRDRIERIKPRAFGSLSKASQDMEVTPIKSVTSVQAKKDNIRTKVTVYASGNTIEFRFGHSEANRFKTAIMDLILGAKDAPPPATAVAAAPVVDVADQLEKFAKLRDQGILSEEEFQAQKQKLLG
jgi:hypothetical protein